MPICFYLIPKFLFFGRIQNRTTKNQRVLEAKELVRTAGDIS